MQHQVVLGKYVTSCSADVTTIQVPTLLSRHAMFCGIAEIGEYRGSGGPQPLHRSLALSGADWPKPRT